MTQYKCRCIRWRPGFCCLGTPLQVANAYKQNLYAQQYDHGAHLAAVKAEEQERAAMWEMP